jgi:serine protease Do
VVAQLQKDGRVTRGWLGVTIQDVDKNLAESFGLDRPRGALISQLADNGPADKAGLKSGDVIITFDGQDIPTSSDLPHVVGLIEPGSKVEAEIVRDGKRRTIDVKVGGLGADDSYSLTAGVDDVGQGGRLGLIVDTAGSDTLERWGINGGVTVREVLPGSPAAEAGVLVGDVITLLGSRPIKSAEAFAEAEQKLANGSSVPLRLIRRGNPMFIGLKLQD